MSDVLTTIEAKLDENIPRDVVSKRDAGGGRKLDYLEAWYVIDRMNKIFGNIGWNRETIEMKQLPGDKPAYMAKVRVTAHYPPRGEFFTTCIKEGYGYGSAKGSSQDHELAIKEAESDAFKRAAMQFGLSMGLALYDKTQEFVEDAPRAPSKAPVSPAIEKIAGKPAVGMAVTKEVIKQAFGTLKALNKITAEKFVVEYVKPFGADRVDSLDDAAVLKVYNKIKDDFKELKLQ